MWEHFWGDWILLCYGSKYALLALDAQKTIDDNPHSQG